MGQITAPCRVVTINYMYNICKTITTKTLENLLKVQIQVSGKPGGPLPLGLVSSVLVSLVFTDGPFISPPLVHWVERWYTDSRKDDPYT